MARRRVLLERLLLDPDDQQAREALTDLVAEGRHPPRPAAVRVLTLVAATCAILALGGLLAGMDVTAALLAVAGLYTVLIIRRRLDRSVENR